MPGLHLQRNRRKSAIQKIYDGRGNLNDGCVAGGARLLRRLSCRWSPGIRPDKEIMDLLKLSLENNDFILMMIGIYKFQAQQWAKHLPQIMQTYPWLNGRKKHLKRHENNLSIFP